MLKIFLAGRVAAESDGAVLDESGFPGRQGRLLFACLVLARGKPVTRHELAGVLWDDVPPTSWQSALRVLVSKLRRSLAGLAELEATGGGYRLELPPAIWVDVLAAETAVHEAEDGLAAGELDAAVAAGTLAESLLCERFMPGDDGAWVLTRRRELDAARIRALDVLADASLRAGRPDAAVKWANQAVEIEPFRESGYRQLMAAHAAGGNRAEALRVYDRCRRLLAEELGAFPSPETEAIYRELLQQDSPPPQVAAAPQSASSATGTRRVRLALGLAALLAAGAVSAILALIGNGSSATPIRPDSLIRVDPTTLKATEVAPVGHDPDLVVAAGGYLWVTNLILRGPPGPSGLVNTGNRTLTRIDPTTDKAVPVSGGLAPCGITADPSGDVWVANCYPRIPGLRDDVVRVGARQLQFKKIWAAPGGPGYYRGLAYGGGSLWVSQIAGTTKDAVTRVDPETGAERTVALPRAGSPLAWSGSYGNLWIANFNDASITRLQPATGKSRVISDVAGHPGSLAIDGNAIWVGDWLTAEVVRVSAVGSPRPRRIPLPGADEADNVWCVAVGAHAVWATTPGATPADAALWRIDTKTGHATRVSVPYRPACVAADANNVWVTLRR